jgi:V8-like Glu-specific endopeptidase
VIEVEGKPASVGTIATLAGQYTRMALRLHQVASVLATCCFGVAVFVTLPAAAQPPVNADGEFDSVVAPSDEERIGAEMDALQGTKPIYGRDDRIDWGLIKDPRVKAVGSASAALFDKKLLTESGPGRIRAEAQTLGKRLGLCSDESFVQQRQGAFCSGVLIASDLVATAGHCIRELSGNRHLPKLSDIRILFGYTAQNNDDAGRSEFDEREVFGVAEIVSSRFEKNDPRGEDWALLRLDRAVHPDVAKPLTKLRRDAIERGARVYVLGYPSGLPLKYGPGGQVLKNDGHTSFLANLDTFKGNSGSGVFLSATSELVGLLTGGSDDYYVDANKSCQRPYVCRQLGCSGEIVMRVKW